MDTFTMLLFGRSVECALFGKVSFDRTRKTELVLIVCDNAPQFVYQPDWVVAPIRNQTPIRRIDIVELINIIKKARQGTVAAMRPSIDSKLEDLYDAYSREQLKLKACNKIKKTWLHVYYNPWFNVCRRRLEREFHGLSPP